MTFLNCKSWHRAIMVKHKLLKMTLKELCDVDALFIPQPHCFPFSFTNTPQLCSCSFCLEFSFPGLHRAHTFVSFKSSANRLHSLRDAFPGHRCKIAALLPTSLPATTITPLCDISWIPPPHPYASKPEFLVVGLSICTLLSYP